MKTYLTIILLFCNTLLFSQVEQDPSTKNNIRYFCEIGSGYLAGGYEARPIFQIKNGLFIGKNWGIALNTGLESFQSAKYIPIGIDGRFVLLDKKTSPFISMSANYLQGITRNNYYWDNNWKNMGFSVGARIGIQYFFTPSLAVISGFGYRYAQSHQFNQGEISPWQPQEIQINMHRFELSIGLIIR